MLATTTKLPATIFDPITAGLFAAKRSKNDCATLGWTTFLNSNKAVCGESDDGLGPLQFGLRSTKCHRSVDHQSAEAVCLAVGARLCELSEVAAAQGTGCGFESKHIWTSTQCPGGFIAIRGDGWIESIKCTQTVQNVRCCADAPDAPSAPDVDVDCSLIEKDPKVCSAEGMANDLCSHSITGQPMRTLCPYLCKICATASTTTSTSTTTTYTTKTATSKTTVTETTATTTSSTSFPCHIYKCGMHCKGLCGWSKAVKTAGKEGTCIFGAKTVEEELALGECSEPSTSTPLTEDVAPQLPLTNAPEELNAASIWDGDCQTADGVPAKVVGQTKPIECAGLCTVTQCTGFAVQTSEAGSPGDCMLYFSPIVGAKTTTSSAPVKCHVVSGKTTTAAVTTVPAPRVVAGAYLQGAGDCNTVSGAAAKISEAVVDALDCVQLCAVTACTGFATENSAVVASPKCHLYFERIVGVTAPSTTALACYTLTALRTTSSSSSSPRTSSAPVPTTAANTNDAGHPKSSCSAFESGYNYAGNDLQDGSSRASSAEECCDKCSKRVGCKHFTFLQKTCWLKHSDLGRRTSRKGISGSVLTSGNGADATTTAALPLNPSSTTAAAAAEPTTANPRSESLQLVPFGSGCCESEALESETTVWVTRSEKECLALCDSDECHGVEIEFNYWKDVIKSVNCQTYSVHIINGNYNSNRWGCKKRNCWAKRKATTTTTVAATQPSGEVALQIESSSSTPGPITTSAIDCDGPTVGFNVLAPQHLSNEYTWTGEMHAGRPVFEASGASEIYWYWMPAPLGVWAAGNSVGATSIYSYLLEDVQSPVQGTRPFVIWDGGKWVVDATMGLTISIGGHRCG